MNLFYDISWECIKDGVKYSKMVEKEWVFDFLHRLNSDLDEGTIPFSSLPGKGC